MQRRAFITVFILILAFVVIQELKFRQYLYEQHYALAGCLPNFTAAMLLIFGYGLVRFPLTMSQTVRSAVFIVLGLILYEIAQIWIPGRVFDWADIAASIGGGLVSVGMIYLFQEID